MANANVSSQRKCKISKVRGQRIMIKKIKGPWLKKIEKIKVPPSKKWQKSNISGQ